jgi:hypothetical protein
MRQQNIENDEDQRKFIELLPRCRTGQVTIDDWNHLMSRNPSYLNENDFLDSPSLFYSNSDVKEVNNKE